MRFFRNRGFAATNGVSLAMFFGAFGSIFLLAQFFQVAQGYSPLEAGIRTLPWTAMPIFVAPVAGILSDRIGSRPLMAAGLALQAAALSWLALVTTPDVAYGLLVPGFVMAGTGMALVFAPAANAVLRAVRPEEAGQASGAINTIREIGGVLGVAVLATVFTSAGGFGSPQAYVDGLVPAVWVGAAVLAPGALVALLVPASARSRRSPSPRRPPRNAKREVGTRDAMAENLTRQILREHLVRRRAQPRGVDLAARRPDAAPGRHRHHGADAVRAARGSRG